MRSQPTALLFDFGGTLDADGISWRDRVFRLYREAGVTVTAEEFAPHFYRADDGLVGALPATCSLDETVARLFTGLTATLCPGVPPGLATRLAGHFVDDVRRHARASAAILAGLRPRYHLGLVSNFYGNLETVGADLALTPLLGVMVDSTRVGVTKPDPRIFKTALAALGVGAEDALFIGDSLPRDMRGARDIGMPHVWLAGPGEPRTTGACCADDRVIRTLAELPGLLR
jgi:putative hydrolase of the HAD superfamily